MMTKPQLFYFHVHSGKGDHADGEDYEIVITCERHRAAVEADDDAEFITETGDDDDRCDMCPVTADTITDKQLHELNEYHRGCEEAKIALGSYKATEWRRSRARVRCAELLNALTEERAIVGQFVAWESSTTGLTCKGRVQERFRDIDGSFSLRIKVAGEPGDASVPQARSRSSFHDQEVQENEEAGAKERLGRWPRRLI